jgi:hypothetical protein
MCPACDAPSYFMPMATSGMAIAGFVTSFFCGLIGMILSFVALGDIDRSGGRLGGRGLAIAGIAISICSMILGVMLAMGRHH